MQIIDIVGLTGIGFIILTYVILSVIDYLQDCKRKKEVEKRDREWQSRLDYKQPPNPPKVTRSPTFYF